jgi:hypothetical protein
MWDDGQTELPHGPISDLILPDVTSYGKPDQVDRAIALQGRRSMTIASKIVFAALAGLFVANFVSQVQAQVVQGPERDAAIHRCIIQAQREYPDPTADEAQRARTASYKACMTAAGQVP